MAERGIGRGLAAILPSSHDRAGELQDLPLELIRPNPRQPRSGLTDDAVRPLAASIGEYGVLQPVLVRSLPGSGYELIAGERRLRAARIAGLERIPAIVRTTEDQERLVLALTENMAREDLNAVDAARACAALVDELGLSKEEVGRRVGRSRSAISNLIRLLELPDEVLAMIEFGQLSEGHGRALLQTREPHAQRSLAREAITRNLSVRELEQRSRAGVTQDRPRRTARGLDADAESARRQAEDALAAAIGADVRVQLRPDGEGRVEVPFDDLSEVHELVRRLRTRLVA